MNAELIEKINNIDYQLVTHAGEIVIAVSSGYHWTHEGTPEQAARFLAERSRHVLLHVEPVGGNVEQDEIRRMYFEFGGERERR